MAQDSEKRYVHDHLGLLLLYVTLWQIAIFVLQV